MLQTIPFRLDGTDAHYRGGVIPLARAWTPQTDLGRVIAQCFRYLPDDLQAELLERISSVAIVESALYGVHHHGPNSDHPFRVDDYGLLSRKVLTNNGVALIVDALDNTLTDATIKYHGVGTGTTAEAAGDSALVTELTTQYNPDNTRATGTFSQPSANVSQSVATNAFDASATLAEHGVFSQAATGGGTLLDRSVYSGSTVGVVSGDSFQTTYQLTITAGG